MAKPRYEVRELPDGWQVVRTRDGSGVVWYSKSDPDSERMARQMCAGMDADATLARIKSDAATVLRMVSQDADSLDVQAHAVSLAEHIQALDSWLSGGGSVPDGWRKPHISCPQCGGDMTGNRNPDGTCAGHLVSPPGVPLVMCEGKGKPANVITFHD